MSLIADNQKLYEKINANNDHQLWLEQIAEKRFMQDWILRWRFQQRWEADYRLFTHHQNEITIQYDFLHHLKISKESVFKHFEIGPGYNLTRSFLRNSLGDFHWVRINRGILQMDLFLAWQNWQMTHRLRGEYFEHTRPHYRDFGAVRYRLLLVTPFELTPLKLTPFLSNECFFRSNTYNPSTAKGVIGGWYENRFRLGFNLPVYQNYFVSTLFWQWRIRKQPPQATLRWFNTYQLGLGVNFSY